MHKIITFLGVRRPESGPVHYAYSGKTYEGMVFTGPLYDIVRASAAVDKVLIFVTKDARASSLPLVVLDPRLVEAIDIPNGETSEDMWTIFDKLTGAVDHGDEVTFDITHGLRSLPFLVFLAAAFLQSAKQAAIRAIYYGALDLRRRDASGASQPAPVLNLTEFVRLLDWLEASTQMARYGDAGPLVKQLRAAIPEYAPDQDRTTELQRKQLRKGAAALEQVSRALRLTLPDEAMVASADLTAKLHEAAVAMHRWARPFTVLADQVSGAYAPLALANPRAVSQTTSALQHELAMVNWYLERNLLVQATTLAREWIVTWGLVQTGYADAYNREYRTAVEDVFGRANNQKAAKTLIEDHTFPSGRSLLTTPCIDLALTLYQQLGEVRNTLCYANKRPAPIAAEKLENNAVQYCRQISELPLAVPPRTTS